jgi:hypothetical protein
MLSSLALRQEHRKLQYRIATGKIIFYMHSLPKDVPVPLDDTSWYQKGDES